MPDYIAGVDFLPDRNVIDFKSNRYGEIFIDLLHLTHDNITLLLSLFPHERRLITSRVRRRYVCNPCEINHRKIMQVMNR